MKKLLFAVFCGTLAMSCLMPELHAQEGRAERVGEQIDRGLEQLGEKLKSTWADIRKSVDELSVRGRVYGRIRWDKALADQTIDIQAQEKDVVILSGVVPTEALRSRAVQLANETVGVRQVVDQMQVAPVGAETKPVPLSN
jgi:hypothetical protein